MSENRITLPSIEIDESLVEELGMQINIDGAAVAEYLSRRNLSEAEICDTSISVVSYPRYSYETGRLILGSYCPEDGIILHGLTIATKQPWGMRRSRPDSLAPLRDLWKDASLSDRFNYVILHELEHRIDDSKGRHISSGYWFQELLADKQNKVTTINGIVTAGLAYLGLEVFTEPTFLRYSLANLALTPLAVLADMKVARRMRYNEYLRRPHEQTAHEAGLRLIPKLVEVDLAQE